MNTEYPLGKYFDDVSEKIKKIGQNLNLSNDNLLELYGLFKQAKEGDVNTSQPWAIQLEARAKWDAWNKQKGKSQESARHEYVKYALQFFPENERVNYN